MSGFTLAAAADGWVGRARRWAFRFTRTAATALLAASTEGCAANVGGEVTVASAPAPAATPVHTRRAEIVNATILANGCQSLGRPNSQMAERAMYDLVEDCTTVPGGSAAFQATLRPGGRIDIGAAPGGPAMVPICILKHALVHKVALARPCVLDVKLEQTTVPVAAP